MLAIYNRSPICSLESLLNNKSVSTAEDWMSLALKLPGSESYTEQLVVVYKVIVVVGTTLIGVATKIALLLK